jgi:PAS domain S-box-containing protein
MELKLNRGERIVSKTDTEGYITEVNDMFEKYSEYKESELIGKNHNIIRHPDMPRIVFRLLWVKIYNNLDVNAFVKNRTKKGNHYWVYATASPIINRTTNTKKGYISIRKMANEEAVLQLEELYASLKEMEQKSGDYLESKEALRALLQKEGMKFNELMSKMQAQGAILNI